MNWNNILQLCFSALDQGVIYIVSVIHQNVTESLYKSWWEEHRINFSTYYSIFETMPLEDYGNFESYNEEIRDKRNILKHSTVFKHIVKPKKLNAYFAWQTYFASGNMY